MTAPNSTAVIRCIESALRAAGISGDEVDAINGHLTGTMADTLEINNLSKALRRGPDSFPLINSTKSIIGHCLGAAGSVECVASILELASGFVHGSLNCEDLHPEILPFSPSIVQRTREVPLNVVAKASFGFGDVNGCLRCRRWV